MPLKISWEIEQFIDILPRLPISTRSELASSIFILEANNIPSSSVCQANHWGL